jgi:hypothetical protein
MSSETVYNMILNVLKGHQLSLDAFFWREFTEEEYQECIKVTDILLNNQPEHVIAKITRQFLSLKINKQPVVDDLSADTSGMYLTLQAATI